MPGFRDKFKMWIVTSFRIVKKTNKQTKTCKENFAPAEPVLGLLSLTALFIDNKTIFLGQKALFLFFTVYRVSPQKNLCMVIYQPFFCGIFATVHHHNPRFNTRY